MESERIRKYPIRDSCSYIKFCSFIMTIFISGCSNFSIAYAVQNEVISRSATIDADMMECQIYALSQQDLSPYNGIVNGVRIGNIFMNSSSGDWLTDPESNERVLNTGVSRTDILYGLAMTSPTSESIVKNGVLDESKLSIIHQMAIAFEYDSAITSSVPESSPELCERSEEIRVQISDQKYYGAAALIDIYGDNDILYDIQFDGIITLDETRRNEDVTLATHYIRTMYNHLYKVKYDINLPKAPKNNYNETAYFKESLSYFALPEVEDPDGRSRYEMTGWIMDAENLEPYPMGSFQPYEGSGERVTGVRTMDEADQLYDTATYTLRSSLFRMPANMDVSTPSTLPANMDVSTLSSLSGSLYVSSPSTLAYATKSEIT